METARFNEALARLDAEIVEAEARLADLRLKRKGAEAFLAYIDTTTAFHAKATPSASAGSDTGPSTRPAVPPSGPAVGVTELVESIMRDHAGQPLDVRAVMDESETRGRELTREQVRNAVHYLTRKGVLERPDRGIWLLRNAETPALTGVSVGNIRPEPEGGDFHETTAAPASAAEDQHHPQLGAPVTEVAS